MFNVPNKCVGCSKISRFEDSIVTPQAAAESAIGARIIRMSGAKLELEGDVVKGPASNEFQVATTAMTNATNYALQAANQITDLVNGCPGLQPGGVCGNEIS